MKEAIGVHAAQIALENKKIKNAIKLSKNELALLIPYVLSQSICDLNDRKTPNLIAIFF
jgi:hypothetical protein